MEYWKKVDIGDYTKWTQKVNGYFNTIYHTRPRHELLRNKTFWNPVLIEDVNTYFPELVESTCQFGQINEVSILVIESHSTTLHIDHTVGLNHGVMARLNIPLLNCEGSCTSFFNISQKDYDTHQTTLGGTKYWTNEQRDTFIPVTSVELVQPTILRTSTPHAVFCKSCKFPRMALTVSFKDDIVRLLDE